MKVNGIGLPDQRQRFIWSAVDLRTTSDHVRYELKIQSKAPSPLRSAGALHKR
jgi:hypothetical protein